MGNQNPVCGFVGFTVPAYCLGCCVENWGLARGQVNLVHCSETAAYTGFGLSPFLFFWIALRRKSFCSKDLGGSGRPRKVVNPLASRTYVNSQN